MGAKGDWEKYLEPIRPRHLLETTNNLNSSGEVGIKDGIFHDNRLPHTVYVDSITQQTIDEFETRGVDLMVREVPMQTTVANESQRGKEYGDHRASPDLVLFDVDNMKVAGYEAKSVPTAGQGLEELQKWGEDVKSVNDFYDVAWSATGHPVEKEHINDEYNSPSRSPRGVYASEESLDKVRNSDELRKMFNGLYGNEADIEDAILVSEVREEWDL